MKRVWGRLTPPAPPIASALRRGWSGGRGSRRGPSRRRRAEEVVDDLGAVLADVDGVEPEFLSSSSSMANMRWTRRGLAGLRASRDRGRATAAGRRRRLGLGAGAGSGSGGRSVRRRRPSSRRRGRRGRRLPALEFGLGHRRPHQAGPALRTRDPAASSAHRSPRLARSASDGRPAIDAGASRSACPLPCDVSRPRLARSRRSPSASVVGSAGSSVASAAASTGPSPRRRGTPRRPRGRPRAAPQAVVVDQREPRA